MEVVREMVLTSVWKADAQTGSCSTQLISAM